MQSKAATIEAYLASVDEDTRAILRQLDSCIRKNAPATIGGMKYGMPAYVVGERMLGFNAQKHYFSFYADPEIVAEFKADLAGYSVGKSCIRFRTLTPELLRILEKITARHDQ